jgi:hypothetical protein
MLIRITKHNIQAQETRALLIALVRTILILKGDFFITEETRETIYCYSNYIDFIYFTSRSRFCSLIWYY